MRISDWSSDVCSSDLLAGRARQQWQRRSKRWLGELSRRVAARHADAGEVAYLLEPDLKDGQGGLRDVHALRWAEAARHLLWDGDDAALAQAYEKIGRASCRERVCQYV